MKSLRTLTAGERRRITDGDPADLDVVELLARREWDRLEFTRRAGLLIVRPMNGSSRGGVSVYSDDVTDSDAFFDPPTPLGVVRRDGACPTRHGCSSPTTWTNAATPPSRTPSASSRTTLADRPDASARWRITTR